MDKIKSANNENIRLLRKLASKKYRKEYGKFVAEGMTLVKSIPDIVKVSSLFVKESAADKTEDILDRFCCPVFQVDDNVFDKAMETITPSGIAAIIDIERKDIRPPRDNSLVLDRISDPGNLGTIIRTAVACNYSDVYLINCADAYSGKAVRASMGGIFSVNIYEIEYSECKKLFSESAILALDTNGVNIYQYKPNKDKLAIIIGNEAHGVSEELLSISDAVISLPMTDRIESLNASVAAGATMYVFGGKQYGRT